MPNTADNQLSCRFRQKYSKVYLRSKQTSAKMIEDHRISGKFIRRSGFSVHSVFSAEGL